MKCTDGYECEDCHTSIYFVDGMEWPEDLFLCWECLHKRYENGMEVLKDLSDFSFSFDPRDQQNAAYRDAVRNLQKKARKAIKNDRTKKSN